MDALIRLDNMPEINKNTQISLLMDRESLKQDLNGLVKSQALFPETIIYGMPIAQQAYYNIYGSSVCEITNLDYQKVVFLCNNSNPHADFLINTPMGLFQGDKTQTLFEKLVTDTDSMLKIDTYEIHFGQPVMEYDIDPVDGTFQLRCGDVTIPLKQPFAIRYIPNGTLYSYDFEIEISSGNTRPGKHKELIRRFLKLEQKAARGLLSDQETKVWEKICGIVDQDKLFRMRERKNPNRAMAQIIEDNQGKRAVKLLTGLILTLSDNALEALEFLEKGDWFEAGIIMDSNRQIIEIQNVYMRSEPYIPTDEEIDAFFESRQMD